MSATKPSNLVTRFAVLSSHSILVVSNETVFSTPRKALGTITNRTQPSSSEQKCKTRAPTTLTTPNHENGGASSNDVVRTGFESSASIRRRQVSPRSAVLAHVESESLTLIHPKFSKQRGDLSQLRPVSPLLHGLAQPQELSYLSPGSYVDDVPSEFYAKATTVEKTPHTNVSEDMREESVHPLPPGPISSVNDSLAHSAVIFLTDQQNVCKFTYHAAGSLPPTTARQLNNTPVSEHKAYLASQDTATYDSEDSGHDERKLDGKSGVRKHHNRPIFIQNLGQIDWSASCDVFKPIIRPYPPINGQQPLNARGLEFIREAPPVDYLSISTAWKGLSLRDARQLLRMNQAFGTAVSHLLAGQLTDLPRVSAPNEPRRRRCYLNWSHLVDLLKGTLGLRAHDEQTSIRFNDLLCLYLSKVDCFQIDDVNHLPGAVIDLILSYQNSPDHTLTQPRVEATWLPDYLAFPGVNYFPLEGDPLVIIPQYRSLVSIGFERLEDKTTYSLATHHPWLKWDCRMSGWKGVIPNYSQIRTISDEKHGEVYRTGRVGPDAIANILRIEVIAHREEILRSGIRAERTLRARLTIKVKPYWIRERTVSSNLGIDPKQPTTGGEAQNVCVRQASNTAVRSRSSASTESTGDPSTECSSSSSTQSSLHFQDSTKAHLAQRSDVKGQPTVRDPERQFGLYQAQNRKGCLGDPISDLLERCGLSGKAKPEMAYDNDVQAYPITAIPTGHHNSHMFASPYLGARRTPNSIRSSGGHSRGSSTSDTVAPYYRFLANIQASLNAAATKNFTRASVSENPTSPSVARAPSTSLEALQRVPQRHISLRTITPAASGYSTDERHGAVQPASAELLAIAQSLHHEPDARKRASRSSFEQSPPKRNCEYESEESEAVGCISPSVLTTAELSIRSKEVSDRGSETSETSLGSNLSSPPPVNNRPGVVASSSNTNNVGDKDRESGDLCPESRDSDPYNDSHTRGQQEIVRAILREIPSERTERITLQERMDLFKAMKQSYEDAAKARNEKLGIHFSEGFTDSQVDTSDSDSSIGHDIEDILASVSIENSDETEVSQASQTRATSPPSTSRPKLVFNYLPSQPSTESQCATKADSDSASDESSEFEEDPMPALEPNPLEENQGSKPEATSQENPLNRPTPLMGLFGAGSAARGRGVGRGLGFSTRSRGVSRWGGQPKCFGCDARHAE